LQASHPKLKKEIISDNKENIYPEKEVAQSRTKRSFGTGQDIKIIIGLGNPGKEYEKTYHNVGFLFIDYLNHNPNLQMYPNLQILKSENFMNESGSFVAKILKKKGIKPENLFVVHDDSDIETGKYKVSFGRGSAGHNGVESIIKALKTKNFWRLRIGIRPPIRANQRLKASDFVLKKIGKKDMEMLKEVFEKIKKELAHQNANP